jgi:ABC-2 type transport system ATP-binding protein
VGANAELEQGFAAAGHATRRAGERLVVESEGESAVTGVLERALSVGARVVEVTPRHETLEDLFLREAILKHDA